MAAGCRPFHGGLRSPFVGDSIMARNIFASVALAAVTIAAGGACPAAAQQDFYAGKQLTFIVGAGVGGGYDLQARTTARHLAKHIPGNPTVVVQNMPAAGGMAGTNFLYSGAPKDGTTMALV